MVRTLGACAWGGALLLLLAVGGCKDSPEDTCNKVCDKIIECLPAQVEKQLEKLPPAAKEAARKELEKGAAESEADCKKNCAEQPKEVSEAEKKDLAKMQACLSKSCDEFAQCIQKL